MLKDWQSFIYNNLVSNPGRGVIWINEPYNNSTIRNNHIITRTASAPRKEGLFGFNPNSDFETITIRGHIIDCQEQTRPLLRNRSSDSTTIENNTLTNVSRTDLYVNPQEDQTASLQDPLKFQCGVHGETTVDGWKVKPSKQ